MRLKPPSFLSGLLFKLLFAYMAVTLVSWIISSTLLGLFEYYKLRQAFAPREIVAAYAAKIAGTELYFDDPPNAAALASRLAAIESEVVNERRNIAPDIYSNYENFDFKKDAAAIYDRRGAFLIGNKTRPDESFVAADAASNDREAQRAIAAILGGAREFSVENEYHSVIVALPLRNPSGELGGVLLVNSKMSVSLGATIYKLTWNWFNLFGTMIVMFAATGLIFSFLIGRGFVRRLRLIAAAADAWSVGDFSARAADRSGDEIGHLARRLNGMASDLSDFFRLKQELAAAAERNKIARDLHDSIKQQVFALSMQLGAANLLKNQITGPNLNEPSAAADRHLAEAEKLAQSVQRELVDLINELRPTGEYNESLATRLTNFAADWKRQNKIPVELEIDDSPLSPPIEDALFRIVQEALANTARHAAARRVTIALQKSPDGARQLVVADDGRGFDALSAKKGFGLGNMRERAEALPQGGFFLESKPGRGTKIIAAFRADYSNADLTETAEVTL